MVKNRANSVAAGVTREDQSEISGLWIAENAGARFWLSVMNEMKNRGVQDVPIAVVPSRQISFRNRLPGNMTGFPEAITAAFSETTVHTGIVYWCFICRITAP